MLWFFGVTLALAAVNGGAALPPRILQGLATVQVPGGVAFSYQLSRNSFQSDKGDNALDFRLSSSDGNSLPGWLTFNPVNLTISGVPYSLRDTTFSWNLSATDSGGETATQSFRFVSAVPCPDNSFRHFRLRVADAGPRAACYLCSVLWTAITVANIPPDSSNPASFPSAADAEWPGVNITGTGAAATFSRPDLAFQQLTPARCSFEPGTAWVVCPSLVPLLDTLHLSSAHALSTAHHHEALGMSKVISGHSPAVVGSASITAACGRHELSCPAINSDHRAQAGDASLCRKGPTSASLPAFIVMTLFQHLLGTTPCPPKNPRPHPPNMLAVLHAAILFIFP